MLVDPALNTCNWNLKFINKIGLKINVKIKLGQILGSTMLKPFLRNQMVFK